MVLMRASGRFRTIGAGVGNCALVTLVSGLSYSVVVATALQLSDASLWFWYCNPLL